MHLVNWFPASYHNVMDEGKSGGFLAKRRRPKWSTLVIIVLLHVVAIFALASALAPKWTGSMVERVESMVTVNITAPPEPTPDPSAKPKPDEGAAAAEAAKAKPKEVTAPKPKITPKSSQAPKSKSTGNDNKSGGGEQGSGSGAGGQGDGTGSGQGGDGQGNGKPPPRQAVPPRLIASISDPSLFPIPPGGRKARIGTKTIVRLNVSKDGRVTSCRVVTSSGFPETDATVCQLAPSKIRFEPARDQYGDPIASVFGYQQRYFN